MIKKRVCLYLYLTHSFGPKNLKVMKKTIIAAVAALLALPAMAATINSTTNVRSYTTNRRAAREYIDRVATGNSSSQKVVMTKGKKGLTHGVAYNEDILAVEYANLVPVEVEENATQQVAPTKQKSDVKKANVKKAKKNKAGKASLKAKKNKGKSFAKANKAKKGRLYARHNGKKYGGKKAISQRKAVRNSEIAQNSGNKNRDSQRAAKRRTRKVYRPQGESAVVLEEVSAVYLPGNEPLLSEERHVR